MRYRPLAVHCRTCWDSLANLFVAVPFRAAREMALYHLVGRYPRLPAFHCLVPRSWRSWLLESSGLLFLVGCMRTHSMNVPRTMFATSRVRLGRLLTRLMFSCVLRPAPRPFIGSCRVKWREFHLLSTTSECPETLSRLRPGGLRLKTTPGRFIYAWPGRIS